MFISWPTKRLLMAEIGNEDGGEGNSRDGCSSPGGETAATLASALDSVQQGYEPYAGFPSAFVAEELKLLIAANGPKFPAGDLLTDRDWKAHAKCNSSGPGVPPLAVQVDEDVADFLRQMAESNGIDLDGYANQLLGNAALDELGRGEMILSRSRSIGGVHIDRGARVQADPVAGDVRKRHVTVKVGRKTVEGVVDVADLLKPEDAEQDRALILQRAKKALAGLKVAVHPLAGEGEAGSHMVRVACNTGDQATLAEVNRRLKAAGLLAYTQGRTVLHVRA